MDVEGVGGKLSLEKDGGRDLAHICDGGFKSVNTQS